MEFLAVAFVDLSELVIDLSSIHCEGFEVIAGLWVAKSPGVEQGNPHREDIRLEGVVLGLEHPLL